LIASLVPKAVKGLSYLREVVLILAVACARVVLLLHGVTASTFYNCLFYVDSPSVNFRYLVVSDQIVCNVLLFERNKTKTSTLSGVDVLQNNSVNNFTELIKVIFKLIIC
jgi:hypothetical protein